MARHDPHPMSIADALVAQRQARGDISQEAAAEAIGTTKQTIGRWEKGAQPAPEWVSPLAKFLRLPVEEVRILRRSAGPADRLDQIEARLGELEELVSRLVEGPARRGRPGGGR